MSFGEMWLSFGQEIYNYDDNFKDVSEYTKKNIKKLNLKFNDSSFNLDDIK